MEDKANGLDWSLLLPEVSLRLVDETFTAQDLSALLVILFLLVAGGALAYLAFRAKAAVRAVDRFLNLLDGATPSDVVAKRPAIRAAARKTEHEGALWTRFDRTLVLSADGAALYSTQDCANIFNVHTVARDPVENGLITALPGMLTLLGILGTVIVLQLGLGGTPAKILADHVAVAFSTSVWGVTAAVTLQLASHGAGWFLRWRLDYLHQRLQRLFPRVGDKHMLVSLEHYEEPGEVTHASLQSLVDSHMRNTLDVMAQDLQATMQDAMSPTLDNLKSVADELSARRDVEVVESLVREQRGVLERLAGEVGAALTQLNTGFGSLLQDMDAKLDRYAGVVEQHAVTFAQQTEALSGQCQGAMDKADAVLQVTLEGAEQLAIQGEQTRQRDKATRGLVHELDTARYNIEHTVDELKRRAQLANKTLDQLEVGYTAFLDGLSDSAADSGARMSNLLIEYSQQMSEQVRERLADWRQMTVEFSASMSGALDELQTTLKNVQSAPAPKRRAARAKRPAAPKRAPKSP